MMKEDDWNSNFKIFNEIETYTNTTRPQVKLSNTNKNQKSSSETKMILEKPLKKAPESNQKLNKLLDFFQVFPSEICIEVASQLDVQDLVSISRVCMLFII